MIHIAARHLRATRLRQGFVTGMILAALSLAAFAVAEWVGVVSV